MPSAYDIEHLLRRTEYVARPNRVAELTGLATLAQVVDNVLSVPTDPGSIAFQQTEGYLQGEEYVHFWLDRMAHDSPRPIQEKVAFFWHGHFCSELNKVHSPTAMRDQIDMFRRDGLGSVRTLTKRVSRHVAMLRYLDNNANEKNSPNQNFGRELMELFLLGVGNYSENDVIACTAAWTGHTDNPDPSTAQYVWRADWHDGRPKQFLGRTINTSANWSEHGDETIDVILGDGVVPSDARRNANRSTRELASEHLTRKLWWEFAGTEPSPGTLGDLARVGRDQDFELRPWLRALLLHPDFYSQPVRDGLVRSPVSFVVAVLVATGLRSNPNVPMWRLPGMGQMPLYPPDVSGWGRNEAFLNSSSMSQRMGFVRDIGHRVMPGYWDGDGLIHLAGGTVSRVELEEYFASRPEQLADRFLELMRVSLSSTARNRLVQHAQQSLFWERSDLVQLILACPEFQMC